MSTFDDLLRARLDSTPLVWPATALRHAAVLCPVVVENGEDQLLFAARPTTLRQHAGQIGFPGGMRDGDEAPVATALRECREEVGVNADRITVLGSLPPRESSSGILVLCLVARLLPTELCLDAREVERVLYMPIRLLCDETRWAERPPPLLATGKQPRVSPHFQHDGDLLWGLTARFVHDLVVRLRGVQGS